MANESHLQIEKFVQQSGLQLLEKQALGFYTRAALPNRIIADTDQTAKMNRIEKSAWLMY